MLSITQDEWEELYTNNEAQTDLFSNIENCSCGNILINNTSSTMICNNCGTTRDIDEDINNDGGGYKEMPMHRKIRIVGENSAKYRSDVFRCANTYENEFQAKCELIFDELTNIYEKYLEYITTKKVANKLKITKNILKSVAANYILCTIPSNNPYMYEHYKYGLTEEEHIKHYKEYVSRIQTCMHETAQERTILRSANKKETLSALLYYICLSEGFSCQKFAISKMFHLSKDGFASGEKYIRFFVSHGKIDIDLNISRVLPEINTLFNDMEYLFTINDETIEDYENLKEVVILMHEILEKKFIAENSCVKSRIIGSSYIVIKRCKNKKLIADSPTISKFCSNGIIRKTTVEKFITEVKLYHSHFVDVYKQYNLEHGRDLYI